MRYGQRPEAVKNWGVDEFDEAFIIWQGEGEYKLTEAEIKDNLKERGLDNPDALLLDKDKNYWKKFIIDGSLSADKLKQAKFRPEQFGFIAAELQRRGWLSSDDNGGSQ